MQTRTRSLMATLTRTDGGDWLVGLRRGPAAVPTAPETDVERGAESRAATVIGFVDDRGPEGEANAGTDEAPDNKNPVCPPAVVFSG